MSDRAAPTPSAPTESAPTALPPGQFRYAGRIIAVVVFLGVVLATAAIFVMPEQTVDRHDVVRLYPDHTFAVRVVGERGVIEIRNDGPEAVSLQSPNEGMPLAEPVQLATGQFLRLEVRGVGAVEVTNRGESVTTIHWLAGGPEPIFIDHDAPRVDQAQSE